MMLTGRIDAAEVQTHILSQKKNLLVQAAREYVDRARNALKSHRFERAWRNLAQAEGLILAKMSPAQLDAKANALATEAKMVLPPEDAQPIVSALEEARVARETSPSLWLPSVLMQSELYDRRVMSLYDARERASGRILTLLAAMLVLLIVLIVMVVYRPLDTSAASEGPLCWHTILAACIFGGMGACLSALFGFVVQGKRPSAFEGIAGTLARPVVGAVSGLIGLMIARYGLKPDTVFASLVTAFFFGFSERLVFAAAQRLESK